MKVIEAKLQQPKPSLLNTSQIQGNLCCLKICKDPARMLPKFCSGTAGHGHGVVLGIRDVAILVDYLWLGQG